MGLRSWDDARAELAGGDTGWEQRVAELGDEMRSEVTFRASPVSGIYTGNDPDTMTASANRVYAEQYSVGPQEAP
jgi:hypothetical protein